MQITKKVVNVIPASSANSHLLIQINEKKHDPIKTFFRRINPISSSFRKNYEKIPVLVFTKEGNNNNSVKAYTNRRTLDELHSRAVEVAFIEGRPEIIKRVEKRAENLELETGDKFLNDVNRILNNMTASYVLNATNDHSDPIKTLVHGEAYQFLEPKQHTQLTLGNTKLMTSSKTINGNGSFFDIGKPVYLVVDVPKVEKAR